MALTFCERCFCGPCYNLYTRHFQLVGELPRLFLIEFRSSRAAEEATLVHCLFQHAAVTQCSSRTALLSASSSCSCATSDRAP